MIKQEIKYVDWDGVPQSKVIWFHLSETKVADMEFSGGQKLSERLKQMAKAKDSDELYGLVKFLVLNAYGVRNGEDFWQNEQVSAEFQAKAYYNEFMKQLMSHEDVFFAWLRGCLPKGVFDEAVEKSGVQIDTSNWVNKPDPAVPQPHFTQSNPYPPVGPANLAYPDPLLRQHHGMVESDPIGFPTPPAFQKRPEDLYRPPTN